jgi:hypothetical protein
MHGFNRRCGLALLCGGALTVLINGILTPLLLGNHSPPAITPTTNVFLLRQSASAAAALLLIFGSLGLHLVQRITSGAFGAAAFLMAFVGGCSVFAIEFADVFVLRSVAQASADTYATIDKSPFMNIGFAVGLFAVGWALLSIGVLRTRKHPRWAALATLAGLFLIPGLQAASGAVGAIAGNVVFERA